MKIKTVTYNDKQLRIYNDELINLTDLMTLINCERTSGTKIFERYAQEIQTTLVKNSMLDENDKKISNRGMYFINEKSAKFIIYKTTNTTKKEKNSVIRFLNENLNEFKFEGRNVAKMLGYKDLRSIAMVAVPNDCKIKKPTQTNGSLQNKIFLNEKGVLILINRSRKLTESEKIELITKIKGDNVYIVDSRKEIEFIEKLKKQLIVFGISEFSVQHNVNGKRIDLYLPEINVAIEYDENDHASYSYEAQEGREKMIRMKLGCEFIRVSDAQDDQTNCAIVLKELMNMDLLS